MSVIYDFTAQDLVGNTIDFADFTGKVLLIVNTASECGFTPQFAGLQALHEQYHDQGLVVIGFPCNQFGKQEPNDGAAIGEFCQRNYGVEFLMMQKNRCQWRARSPNLYMAKVSARWTLDRWHQVEFHQIPHRS